MAFTQFMRGRQEQIGWVAETSYASGGTMSSGSIVGLNAKITPDQMDQGWQEIENAGDTNRYVSGETAGPKTLRFNMTFTPVDWSWLKYVFTDSPAGTSPTTHTLSIPDTVQSFKLEWARKASTNHVLTLIGCVITNATISFQKATGEGQEGLLVVSAQCIAKNYSEGSSITSLSALTADDAWKFLHVKMTVNTTEVVEINSGEIVLDNGIDISDSRYCNSTLSELIGEPIHKTFRNRGSFNVNWKDKTFYTHWNSRAYVSGTNQLEFIKDSEDYMKFTFQNFVIVGAVPPTNPGGVTAGDIVWRNSGGFTTLEAKDDLAAW